KPGRSRRRARGLRQVSLGSIAHIQIKRPASKTRQSADNRTITNGGELASQARETGKSPGRRQAKQNLPAMRPGHSVLPRLCIYQGNVMTQGFMICTGPRLARVTCGVVLLGALGNVSAQAPQPATSPAQTAAAAKAVPATARTNLAKQVPMRAH